MERFQSDPPLEWNAPAVETGLEEPMWQLELGSRDFYPERPGKPDCDYYMRTGNCGYGANCRFNHPRDRSMVNYNTQAEGGVGQAGEYPEREGEPVCQYFLKTGTCKFGASCKYHHPHPQFGGGSARPALLNYHGYPLRPGEKECSYYVKTGQCKFGATCKFHHPQPASTSVPTRAPAFYPTVQPPLAPPTQQYEVSATWQGARAPLLTGPYMRRAYGPPVLIPPGMVPISGWNPYQAPVIHVASPSAQSSVGGGPLYGVPQLSYAGPYPPLPSTAGPSSSNERVFPERPGQPECHYYMRTGDCRYGSACRYHHPPEWIVQNTNALGPTGLPVRPGTPPCPYYTQYGVCNFGPSCKFDHPMGTLH